MLDFTCNGTVLFKKEGKCMQNILYTVSAQRVEDNSIIVLYFTSEELQLVKYNNWRDNREQLMLKNIRKDVTLRRHQRVER